MPNRWNTTSMPDMDTARVGASAFTVGTKTYVVGGDTSGAYGAYVKQTTDVWCYDHLANTWTRSTRFPGPARVGAVAFGSTSRGKGYYGMGSDTAGKQEFYYWHKTYDPVTGLPVFNVLPYYKARFYKDWWEFDTATKAWTQLDDFPFVSDIMSDTLPDVFVENGIANASSFSIDTVIPMPIAPPVQMSGNIAGGFVFGETFRVKFDTSAIYQDFINQPYFYYPNTDQWIEGTPLPLAKGRSNASALVLETSPQVPGKNLALLAGLGDNDAYNVQLQGIFLKDWWSYDFGAQSWTRKRDFPDTGKSNAGAFSFVHLGYITGGFDAEWSKHFFQYNAVDEAWLRYPDYRDSGRFMGVAFARDSFGYYGAGYRGNSEEMKTFSWYRIDSNTINAEALYGANDTFCAGSEISLKWTSVVDFTTGATMRVQISNEQGEFEFPITAASDMGSYVINDTLTSDTITATIPKTALAGGGYQIRLISSSPLYISRLTDSFYVKENVNFNYFPKIHPFTDTVCLNADFFIPSLVTGSTDSIRLADPTATFDYQWLKDGNPFNDTTDTLNLIQTQFSHAGVYSLIAKGDCMADTSENFYIAVENIAPPAILDDLDYPGMTGSTLFHCEYDTSTWYITATGKQIRYQWYHNGFPLDTRDNIEDLGMPTILHKNWKLADSGVYKVRVIEECGAYTESDSIVVKMREIPRVQQEPKNIYPAVLEGVTVGFKVKATGYNLNYQWRKDTSNVNNGPRITGAQTDTLSISGLVPSDVAFYSVIVCGGCPGVCDTSNLAIIDLNASPTIVKQPTDTLEICEGSDNVISIVAAGTNMRYDWRYKNRTPLDPNHFFDTTTRILRIVNAQVGMTGYIECEVDNQAGASVISNVVYLKVKPTPDTPNIQQIGGSLLTADVNCETYLWFYNGVWKGQYNTKTIKPPSADMGDYTVRVICNGCPSPLSDPFFFISSVVSLDLNNLEMYPNPAQQKVMLDLPGISMENKATITIFDLSGKMVKTIENVDSESYEMDLQGLSKGMYVVHVSSAREIFSGKLIKE